jgi:hypothetical protein
MTASTQPERGTSTMGDGRGAPKAGPAAAAPAEARKERRLKCFMASVLEFCEVYHGARGARQIFSLPGTLVVSLRQCLIQ